MFFTRLAEIAHQAQIKILISGVSDGKLNVIIEPKPTNEKAKALFNMPFQVTATPEELDAELPNLLGQFSTSTKSLLSQFEEQMKQIEDSAKTATEAAKGKTSHKAAPKVSGTTQAVIAAPAAKEKSDQGALDLFDLCEGRGREEEEEEGGDHA